MLKPGAVTISPCIALRKTDREFFQPPEDLAWLPFQYLRIQVQCLKAAQECAESNLRFDTCKRRAQAKMDTLAEGEMAVFLPVQVKPVRLCKLCRVSICPSQAHEDSLP